METKRTPTPWRAERWTSHAPRTVLVDDLAFLTGKRIVAECESDEDAQFIVTACNAHAQLTAENAALREQLERRTEAANSSINAALMMPCHCAGPETGVRCVPGCDAATPVSVRDQMVDFLRDIDLIEHPDAGDHNPLCQGGEQNVTALDAIIARARKLQSALTTAGQEGAP